MIIPWQKLDRPVLLALLEELVTRDGTDYGLVEIDKETKVQQLLNQLQLNTICLMWDESTETCSIISRNQLQNPELNFN